MENKHLHNTYHRLRKVRILSNLKSYATDKKDINLFFIIKEIEKEMSYHSITEDECDVNILIGVIKKHIDKAIISDDTKKIILSKIRDYKLEEIFSITRDFID